jgi:hypothetical protein
MLSSPKFPRFLFASFPVLLLESPRLGCAWVERRRQLDTLVASFMLHGRNSTRICGTGMAAGQP